MEIKKERKKRVSTTRGEKSDKNIKEITEDRTKVRNFNKVNERILFYNELYEEKFFENKNDFENNDHNSSIKIITDFSLGQFFGKTIFENKDLQKIKKANSKLFDLQIEEFWKVLKLDIFYIRNTIKSWSESKYNFFIQNKKIFIVDKKNSILEIKKTALIKFNMQLKMEIIFMFKTKLEEMINKINNQIFEYQI